MRKPKITVLDPTDSPFAHFIANGPGGPPDITLGRTRVWVRKDLETGLLELYVSDGRSIASRVINI